MDGQRSRVDDAAPVVSGRADGSTANAVFAGWRQSEVIQQSYNPFVELIEARALRDAITSRFLLKPGHLVGNADTWDRSSKAQHELILGLIRRAWLREFVERYLLVRITAPVWSALRREALVPA